jgi:hypothetical protein
VTLESYSDIAAALSQTFDRDLYHQFNREATFLSLLEARPATDKTLSWDVEFTGSGTTPGAVAEGSDVAAGEFNTDKPVPASLPTGLYRAAFHMSDSEIKKARISGGSPEALVNILGDRMLTKGAYLASIINQDLFSGTGTSTLGVGGQPNIIGLYGGAIAASGIYANINQATFSEWASTVLANGGVSRPLSVGLLDQAEEQLFLKCGRSPNFIMTTAGVRRKYSGLFEEVRRIVGDGMGNMSRNAGSKELFYQGEPVRRDKDAPTGKLIMGCAEFMRVEFLPPLDLDEEGVRKKMAMLQGTTGDPGARLTGTSIPFEITPLAKNGNSVKFMLSLELQLKILRRNAFVVINDIDQT